MLKIYIATTTGTMLVSNLVHVKCKMSCDYEMVIFSLPVPPVPVLY